MIQSHRQNNLLLAKSLSHDLNLFYKLYKRYSNLRVCDYEEFVHNSLIDIKIHYPDSDIGTE